MNIKTVLSLHDIYPQLEKLKDIADDIYYTALECKRCKGHTKAIAAVEKRLGQFRAAFVRSRGDEQGMAREIDQLDKYVSKIMREDVYKCILSKCGVAPMIARAHIVLGAIAGIVNRKNAENGLFNIISKRNLDALFKLIKKHL